MPDKNKSFLLRSTACGVLLMAIAGCAVAPKPLTQAEIQEIVTADRQYSIDNQVPVTKPLTLAEAIARAAVYNLDHRAQMMEEALAQGQMQLARYDMLPTLAASAGFISRDNVSAASSKSVLTNRQSLEPSTSLDNTHYVADARLSWNLLDFGVSYYQAAQQANRYLISQGMREKLMQKLIQQTRTAYWRAAAAQKVKPVLKQQLAEVNQALENLGVSERERLDVPLRTLEMRKALLELSGQLEALDNALGLAELELKNLINLPANTELKLDMPEELDSLPEFTIPAEDLEMVALVSSQDISEQVYNARNEQMETRKAILRMLPGIELNAGSYYDSNRYFVNNQWNEISGRVTWNLLRLLSIGTVRDISEARENLATAKRQALNIAVISRLHMSLWRYQDAVNQFQRAQQLHKIEQRISQLARNSASASAGSRIEQIRSAAAALRAELRFYDNYASAQDALGSVFVSLGRSPIPADYRNLTLEEVAQHINENLSDVNKLVEPVMSQLHQPAPAETTDEPAVVEPANAEVAVITEGSDGA